MSTKIVGRPNRHFEILPPDLKRICASARACVELHFFAGWLPGPFSEILERFSGRELLQYMLYCFSIGPRLFQYCTSTAVSVLFQYRSSTAPILFQCCPNTVPVLHQYYFNTISVLFQYCSSTAPVLFQCCSNTVEYVPIRFQYCFSAVPMTSHWFSQEHVDSKRRRPPL